MKKLLFLLLLNAAFLSGAELTVRVRRELSPNLLKNPGFEKLDKNGRPENWWFDNCSKSPYVIEGVAKENGNTFVTVELKRVNSGYWTQQIPVQEGKRYCAATDFRAIGSTAMIWVRTDDWQDGKSPQHHPLSSTEIYITASPRHGKLMIDELSLFIDPALLSSVEADNWKPRMQEVVIPTGHNIRNYFFKPGAYFGAVGIVMIDNCYFGLAEHTVKMTISGGTADRFQVVDNDGKIAASGKLSSGNYAEYKLPSLTANYTVELFDVKGKKIYGGRL